MDGVPEAGDVAANLIPPNVTVSGGSSLKGTLRGWREIVVVCAKLIKWKQPYYPAIVFGVVSLLFLTVYWLDPSFLTGMSMLIMIICVADYVVPLAMPMVFPETSWNNEKEKQYSQACDDLVDAKQFVSHTCSAICGLKDKNPWLYMAAITVSLSTLAWLGNQMHNLLLTYFISLIILSLPGLKEYGILDKAMTKVNKVIKKEKAQ